MSEPAPIDSATELRVRLRSLRASLDADAVAERSDAAMRRVTALDWWSRARHLAVYRPFDGELDPGPLLPLAEASGISTYAPRLSDGHLTFARFDTSSTWTENRYGIPEPDGTDVIESTQLDLVLVPSVAVDRWGRRVGMGAGWYDRTFAWLAGRDRPASVVLVAVVHNEQLVERIDPAPWDVDVDAVVTPTQTILTSREPTA